MLISTSPGAATSSVGWGSENAGGCAVVPLLPGDGSWIIDVVDACPPAAARMTMTRLTSPMLCVVFISVSPPGRRQMRAGHAMLNVC